MPSKPRRVIPSMIAPAPKAPLFCLMDPESNTESLTKKNMTIRIAITIPIAEKVI